MSGVPRYEKLKALLREKIVSGQYKIGDRFFSQNELIEKYGLSFSTVTRALDDLVQDGYLLRQRGKGTFIRATEVQGQKVESARATIKVFSAWNSSTFSLLSSASGIFKFLETMRPDWMDVKFIPHGDEPDDLEPFIFGLEVGDIAVFLYPLQQHKNFINQLSATIPTIVVAEAETNWSGQLLVTPLMHVAEIAVQHLINLGHVNIAVLGDGMAQSFMAELMDGYREALRKNQLKFCESMVPDDDQNPLMGTTLSQVMERNSDKEITAVFALSSAAAVDVLSELNAMGKKPGDGFSLVCYDNLEKAPSAFPRASTVAFSSRDIADNILRMAAQLDSSKEQPPTFIAPKLTVRSSSAACTSVSK